LCYSQTGNEELAGETHRTREHPAFQACLIILKHLMNASMLNLSYALKRRLSRLLLAIFMVLAPSWRAKGDAGSGARSRQPCLSASQMLQFANSLEAEDLRDAYPVAVKLAFANAPLGVAAFEENRSFVYAAGVAPWPGGAGKSREPSRLIRRWIVLKPSIFIIDDEILGAGSPAAGPPCIDSRAVPQVAGRTFRIQEGDGSLAGEVLLPQKAQLRVKRLSPGGPELAGYRIEWASPEPRPGTRFVCVLNSIGGNPKGARVHSESTSQDGLESLTITTGGKVFHLELPPLNEDAGRIEVSNLQGKILLTNRPFPSGILPHGPEGSRLLEEWDRDYQGKKPPPWDIRRPADELQKSVESGTVHACRAVDLCCGSGTDAIYLARHGFQVTAIDIAPTALSQALRKAESAGVTVDWMLADVLALPNLKTFDFIYDRGCYHVVRDQNLEAYLDTLRRISHPGTEMLLLAARRDAQQGSGSLSGVTEDELRFDFLPLFDIEKLQAIRLESNEPGPGPPGWVVLMRRKAQP